MDKIVAYMDILILMTDLFNKCDLNYFMQAFAKPVTSFAGALDLGTNFMFRLFTTDDAAIYTALDTAVTAQDRENVGLNFGIFVKLLFATELPPNTEPIEYAQVYTTVIVD